MHIHILKLYCLCQIHTNVYFVSKACFLLETSMTKLCCFHSKINIFYSRLKIQSIIEALMTLKFLLDICAQCRYFYCTNCLAATYVLSRISENCPSISILKK